MKKAILVLVVGMSLISLAGIPTAYAEDSQTPPSTAPAPDASQCTLKTDLSADMIPKCTEAMAKGDKAMLEGCCQEGDSNK